MKLSGPQRHPRPPSRADRAGPLWVLERSQSPHRCPSLACCFSDEWGRLSEFPAPGEGGAFTPALVNSHLCWRLAARGQLHTWAAKHNTTLRSLESPRISGAPSKRISGTRLCAPLPSPLCAALRPVSGGGVTPTCIFMSVFAGCITDNQLERRGRGCLPLARCHLPLVLREPLAAKKPQGLGTVGTEGARGEGGPGSAAASKCSSLLARPQAQSGCW